MTGCIKNCPIVLQTKATQFFSSGHTNNWAVLVSLLIALFNHIRLITEMTE